MDRPSPSDVPERLQDRLADGRADAFTELYDLFGERMFRCAQWLADGREEAEDAVQDVFISLVRSRERLRRVDDLAAYLFSAVRRRVARSGARARKSAPLPDDVATPALANGMTARDGELREQLEAALRLLPTEQREVVVLKLDGELTFAQIARTLDISPHTAASRYRYAVEKLRSLLGDEWH